jgi:hypothetical protein
MEGERVGGREGEREREAYTGLWWENLRERNSTEDLGVYGGRVQMTNKRDGKAWTELIWRTRGTGAGIL